MTPEQLADEIEYRRASDARGPARTHEKAKPCRHKAAGDACAGRGHRASGPDRLSAINEACAAALREGKCR